MRQIILDTETTGLDPTEGHRIIEIGCVELINRRLTSNNYHQYIQPEREIDDAAIEIHGITNESLADKPRFADISREFLDYVKGAELIIHNAPFDIGFINNEFMLMGLPAGEAGEATLKIGDVCGVIDTLKMARSLHPGQKNDLDSLCRRYTIDNSQRTLHGALLDAEILADVYLAMTGGQTGLFEDGKTPVGAGVLDANIRRLPADRPPLTVLRASEEEMRLHRAWVERLNRDTGNHCVWMEVDAVE
jgi:DNA polymerase-3 subunit epsilon